MARIAYLFSGQGAQKVGMGADLAAAYPGVRALYERSSARLGMDLARLSFEGPEDALQRSEVAQPAIVAASLAALHVLRDRHPGLAPFLCAGLSLGEYTALVAAGALSEDEALRLVSLRGRFMQEACDARPGAMASVLGLAADAVDEVVRELSTEAEPVVLANVNSPKQMVISGARAAVERAGEALRKRGARRVIALAVAGAYHSPLMAPAAEKLRAELERAAIEPPHCPVITNVTAGPISAFGTQPVPEPDAARAIRELLVRQVTAPVLWSASLERMQGDGATAFLELGPGTVLAGLAKQTTPGVPCTSLLSLASFDEARGELEALEGTAPRGDAPRSRDDLLRSS